jgi:hypothetical protein
VVGVIQLDVILGERGASQFDVDVFVTAFAATLTFIGLKFLDINADAAALDTALTGGTEEVRSKATPASRQQPLVLCVTDPVQHAVLERSCLVGKVRTFARRLDQAGQFLLVGDPHGSRCTVNQG